MKIKQHQIQKQIATFLDWPCKVYCVALRVVDIENARENNKARGF